MVVVCARTLDISSAAKGVCGKTVLDGLSEEESGIDSASWFASSPL